MDVRVSLLSLSLVLSHKLLAGTHRSTWDANPTWRLTLPTKRVTPPNKVTFVRGYIAYTRLKYTYVLKIKTRRCCYPRYLTWSSWRKSSFSGGQKRDKSTSKVDECRPTFSAKLSLNVSGETMFSSCCAKLVIEKRPVPPFENRTTLRIPIFIWDVKKIKKFCGAWHVAVNVT